MNMRASFNSLEQILVATAEGVRPPERLTVSEAAEKYRYVNNPGSYVGWWDNTIAPYLVEPMDELTNRLYNTVCFIGPAQCGKTDMFLNYQTHTVVCDPADLMLVQTKQGTARDFSITRVDRLHRHSEDVGKRLLHRQNADNTYDKQYQSGMLLRLSWPSVDELSGRPVPRLWLTDYDRMTQDVDGEGTPYKMAQARTTSFRSFGKVAVETSPGFMLTDPQWVKKTPHEAPPVAGGLAIYNAGDRRRYYWQCVECKSPFEPHYNLLHYPDTKDSVEAGEQCYLACPHCGHWYHHEGRNGDPGKFEMNQLFDRGGHARWVKEGEVWMPDNKLLGTPRRSTTASFWLFGVCAAFSNWKTLVTETLDAEKEYAENGTEETLKTVTNTKRGEVYVPKAQANARSPQTLKARERDIGIRVVPPGVRFLIATIDIQKNRFVVQVHGIGMDDIWIIDRFELKYSNRAEEDKPDQKKYVNPAAYPEDWRLLVSEVMQKTYPLMTDPDREMAVYYTFCDMGGKEGVTKNAYDFYRWLRHGYDDQTNEEIKELYPWDPGFDARFQLVKGEPRITAPRARLGHPDSQRKDRNAGARGEIPVLFLNSNMLKDELDTRLERTAAGGRINFPDWLGVNFYKELTVETRDKDGKWENVNNYRNESWDLLVYCLGGLLHHPVGFAHINWDEPPSWAAEWDVNDLVFSPKSGTSPLAMEPDDDSDWETLGEELM